MRNLSVCRKCPRYSDENIYENQMWNFVEEFCDAVISDNVGDGVHMVSVVPFSNISVYGSLGGGVIHATGSSHNVAVMNIDTYIGLDMPKHCPYQLESVVLDEDLNDI